MLRSTPRRLLVPPAAVALVIAAAVLATGCVGTRTTRNAASVVDFLYPGATPRVEPVSVPVLTLPLDVGIAWVPAGGRGYTGTSSLAEAQRSELLERVASHFEPLPYVDEIQVIPSAYLRPQGGFANLDQVRSLYGVDVVALVSYDQVQFTDQGLLSLTYWTLVGAYVVPGEKNDTHTLLDTAVFDVASRKLLFRAPGTDHTKGRATPANLTEQLREDSAESFAKAAEEMIVHLDAELDAFKQRVRERPEDYQVVKTAEYEGGGSLDVAALALLAALAGGWLWLRRRG